MLNLEKIWHEQLTDLSTSLLRCSHFILGNPKSHFSALLFIRTSDLRLCQKKTNCSCKTAAYLFTFCCIMVPIICIALLPRLGHATGGARVSSTSPQYGRVVTAACDMGCAWCMMRVIRDEKTGSMYTCTRWSLWTLAVTLLARHSSCHTSQPVLFRATIIRRNATSLQSDEKVLHFTSYVVTFSDWVSKWITVCFLLR